MVARNPAVKSLVTGELRQTVGKGTSLLLILLLLLLLLLFLLLL